MTPERRAEIIKDVYRVWFEDQIGIDFYDELFQRIERETLLDVARLVNNIPLASALVSAKIQELEVGNGE